MIHYYIIDTETTGLRAGYQEMTEIGIIRATDRVQLHMNIKCEYPERANFDALAITKKTMADLDKGHSKEYTVEQSEKFFNEDNLTPAHRCIVAHNAPFDRRFLHALWLSVGKSFPANLWLDTVPLTKDWAKKQGMIKPKVALHNACDLLGIRKISEAHNARVDSRNGYMIWKKLVDNGVDYLPFIKTFVHEVASDKSESELYDFDAVEDVG
jgi:DNA polymerase III epsilon subunit-like protein